MQIREQGKKIQLIRTHYNKEKKRTEGKVFARFDKYLSTPPESVLSLLRDDEPAQLEQYLSDRKSNRELGGLKLGLSMLPDYLKRSTDAMSADEALVDFDQAQADKLYILMGDLKKALKKAGFPQSKPVTEPKPTDTKTADLFPEK